MADPARPEIYSIAAHRGFADALVAGLVPRYREDGFGLARTTLLLPSRRAARTVSEAFIRHFGAAGEPGLLMPRMAVVGDLDLDETLGSLLDPIGQGAEIPPAADPMRRWLTLADIVGDAMEKLGQTVPPRPALLTLAREMGRTMDRLLAEDVAPDDLWSERVASALADQSAHWDRNTRLFAAVQSTWLAELAARGEVDAATRRNLLFDHAARRWREDPPQSPIIAAGVTSAAPALARLLRVVAGLPQGAVILPDLDLSLPDDAWDELGTAGDPAAEQAFARGDAVTHPQYHLKLLLNRMGVARGEVQPWHRAGLGKGPPERSHAISSLFLPPQASEVWVTLPPDKRRLAGVRLMESANPEGEAQAIALAIRQALEEQERRVSLITPDRALARRVKAHLERWNILADDTAGQPLSQSAAGRALLLLAEVIAERAAPVPLLALLGHPLVGQGDDGAVRADWLRRVRAMERSLRGPRPAPGIEPLMPTIAKLAARDAGVRGWWDGVQAILAPLLAGDSDAPAPLADWIERLAAAGEALCGERLWAREDGRALASFVEELRANAAEVGTLLAPGDLHTVLQAAMNEIAVRPPYGGHSRVAIYGLLESRMTRADLTICAGLNEGVWPQVPSTDPLLAPAILRVLGVPGADFRIGLSAHDLAGALGAPEVILSRARRDTGGPTIPSRFWLRAEALLGDAANTAADLRGGHEERALPLLAETLDAAREEPAPYPRPAPMPSAAQRRVDIRITALDNLIGDPFQFYAQHILRLSAFDPLDDEPSPKWRGIAVHEILERWHREGGDLLAMARTVLREMNAHPLMRGLWLPRLLAGLQWVEQTIAAQDDRDVIAVERKAETTLHGIRILGRADRIDRLADGSFAIVDYKTGGAPSTKAVEKGYKLQLGLIGLMAEAGGIEGLPAAQASAFEYWSLAKDKRSATDFGKVSSPVKTAGNKAKIQPEDFVAHTQDHLEDAIKTYLLGDAPFLARLAPDYPGYADYDQLMRLDEWFGREDGSA